MWTKFLRDLMLQVTLKMGHCSDGGGGGGGWGHCGGSETLYRKVGSGHCATYEPVNRGGHTGHCY